MTLLTNPTYTPIQTKTLVSAQSTVSFTSIPSTYTDLILICNATLTSGTSAFGIAFNGQSSTYSYTYMYGDGSSANSGRTGGPNVHIGHAGSVPDTVKAHIMNYSNTTTYKTVIATSSLANAYEMATVGLWQYTLASSAINQIDISPDSSTFAAGSTFTLYGILAA